MGGWLALGQGAGEGLDKILETDILRQKMDQAQQQLNETSRANKAREANQQAQLQESSALRRDTAEENLANRVVNETPPNTSLGAQSASLLKMRRPDLVRTNAPNTAADAGFLPKDAQPDYNPGTQPGDVFTGTASQLAGMRSQERLEEAQRQKEMQPDSLQQKTYTLKEPGGKTRTIDANFNPKTGRVTSLAGEDITDRVDHYENPGYQIIQSGDSYARTTRRPGGPTTPLLGPDNKPVGLATTSSTRTMGEGARMLDSHIDQTASDATRLDQAGLFGPVMSRIRHALTTAGTIDEFAMMIGEDPELNRDRLTGKFATELGLLATGAGRVHGGARGGGSPQMFAHFKAMLGDASTLQMFLGRLDAIDDYMSTYAAGPGGGVGGGAAPGTNNNAAPGANAPPRTYYDADGNPTTNPPR